MACFKRKSNVARKLTCIEALARRKKKKRMKWKSETTGKRLRFWFPRVVSTARKREDEKRRTNPSCADARNAAVNPQGLRLAKMARFIWLSIVKATRYVYIYIYICARQCLNKIPVSRTQTISHRYTHVYF